MKSVRFNTNWRSPSGSRVVAGQTRLLPRHTANRLVADRTAAFVDATTKPMREPVRDPAPTEFAVTVEQYHEGRGWYRPPGATKAMRRADALAYLTDRRATAVTEG
jgi:hypothetical protein